MRRNICQEAWTAGEIKGLPGVPRRLKDYLLDYWKNVDHQIPWLQRFQSGHCPFGKITEPTGLCECFIDTDVGDL